MEINNLQQKTTVSIRTTTPVAEIQKVLGEGYGKIMSFLGQNGLEPNDAPYALYRNEDMQALDIEFGFPVEIPHQIRDLIEKENEIQIGELPAGKAAKALHTGPYSSLAPTYEALTNWVKNQGLHTTGICFERYIDDPDTTPADKLRTEVYFLLK